MFPPPLDRCRACRGYSLGKENGCRFTGNIPTRRYAVKTGDLHLREAAQLRLCKSLLAQLMRSESAEIASIERRESSPTKTTILVTVILGLVGAMRLRLTRACIPTPACNHWYRQWQCAAQIIAVKPVTCT